MNALVLTTIAIGGFAVAFLHAAIPTHWLPFVVAARAQHWKKPKTLAVSGFAGAGHVIFTIALGVLVVWGGMAINSRIGKLFPLIAGGFRKIRIRNPGRRSLPARPVDYRIRALKW